MFIQAHFIFNMLTCVYAAVFLLSKRQIVTRTTFILTNLVHQNYSTACSCMQACKGLS